MPKIGFPMPTANYRFQIHNLDPKKHILKKKRVLKEKIIIYFITLLYGYECRPLGILIVIDLHNSSLNLH